jgi:hypothetical protein
VDALTRRQFACPVLARGTIGTATLAQASFELCSWSTSRSMCACRAWSTIT